MAQINRMKALWAVTVMGNDSLYLVEALLAGEVRSNLQRHETFGTCIFCVHYTKKCTSVLFVWES